MYSERINEYLKVVYEKYGMNKMCKVAKIMLVSKRNKSNKDFRNTVHGEICETVLECAIVDFMSRHPKETKEWRLEKGMVLKDLQNPDSPFKTEIDVTLFTPFKILTFECKCYGGDKIIEKECTVVRKGLPNADIYKQHKLHYKTINSNFKNFRLINEKTAQYSPMQIGFFDFSTGTIRDNRDSEWKKVMPLVSYDTIDEVLETYLNKPICWDMECVNKVLDMINKHKKRHRKEHLEYVKGLHGKN